ncbi:hypothetical protein [Paramaledivibacter caminithermalis]|jgi:hypothetical protein|uniref:Uncharacterized protein n=1 Tax=Paramaledivibacter caminithermalis (strain DSM 15212 / CIP 107654 / DViRD3) TaxID=1121301 RepID=A0A1M6K5J6_PARC5|nr:hypothetical protein [Paramaledivibacter caminithermalis]SHJ54211.1 hypothetical protein SAMN02745912_00272 [Paramaledivibacter caminithermalis DSM 15212]
MYVIAEFRGRTEPKQVKKDIVLCHTQFLIEGKNFDRTIGLTAFNEDVKKVQQLKKGQIVILEFNQRFKNGYLNSTYINHIADDKKVAQFQQIVNFSEKVPS